jgi:hypothetical protein
MLPVGRGHGARLLDPSGVLLGHGLLIQEYDPSRNGGRSRAGSGRQGQARCE